MATSRPNSNVSTDRIRVQGIPTTINADKLTIHFQRRKYGGGDVRSVTFPVSSKESDTAIIIFEDGATVESVLKNEHKISGKLVTVTALEPQPKIFESVVAQISQFALQKIKSSTDDIDELFEDIADATGCVIKEKQQSYEVKGEWYQVQATFDKLENLVSDNLENKKPVPTPATPSSNGYLSTPVAPTQPPVSAPARARNVVSIIVDKDIYAYMEKVRSGDLDKIKLQFQVSFQRTKMGTDASKIEVIPISGNSDPDKAAKLVEELSQSIQNEAGQDVIEIDSSIPASAVDGIFLQLRPEFPFAHIDRVDAMPNQIIVIAPDGDKCRMASEMLKYYLNSAKSSGPTSTATTASATEGDNKIDVDKDIYQYMRLVDGASLDRLWDSCGVKVNETTIGDCLKLEFVPKGSTMPFRPQEAIDRFQKRYAPVNDSACQEMFDVSKLKKPVSKGKILDTVKKITSFHKQVHISQMIQDPDQVLFIASSKEKCDSAMKIFGHLLEVEN